MTTQWDAKATNGMIYFDGLITCLGYMHENELQLTSCNDDRRAGGSRRDDPKVRKKSSRLAGLWVRAAYS